MTSPIYSLLRSFTCLLGGCCLLTASFAGSATFEFTGGSLAPTTTNLPTGVTISDLTIGTGLGDLTDGGAAPDSLRISAADTGSSTGTALSTADTLSFSITIPANQTVNLTSLTLDTQGTGVSGYFISRVFSTIHGTSDIVADTIGQFGRHSTGTDAQMTTDTISLQSPSTAPSNGANVDDGDFDNLTNQVITFYLPWADNVNNSSYIDIDNLTLNLAIDGPDRSVHSISIDAASNIHLTLNGTGAAPYFVYRSNNLVAPLYRKQWAEQFSGSFPTDQNKVSLQEAMPTADRAFYIAGEDEAKARIMCVGDSITEGGSTFFIYRPILNQLLSDAGYRVEFVGSKTNIQAGAPPEARGLLRAECVTGARTYHK